MSGDSVDLVRKARLLLAAAMPGPWECYSLTRNGVGHGVGRKTPSGDDEGICEDRSLLWNDAELIAAAPELLAALCSAVDRAQLAAEWWAEEYAIGVKVLLDRLHAAEAQCEMSRAEFSALADHSTRNVLILNDVATQVCCTQFERLPDVVRELVADSYTAWAERDALRADVARLEARTATACGCVMRGGAVGGRLPAGSVACPSDRMHGDPLCPRDCGCGGRGFKPCGVCGGAGAVIVEGAE